MDPQQLHARLPLDGRERTMSNSFLQKLVGRAFQHQRLKIKCHQNGRRTSRKAPCMPEAALNPIAILSLADDIQRDVTDCQRLLYRYSSLRGPFLKQGVTTRFTRLRAPGTKLRLSAPWDSKMLYMICPGDQRWLAWTPSSKR